MQTQDCSVQFSCSVVSNCDPMDCSTPGFLDHHHLLEFLKLMSIESVMPSNHLIPCCPLLLLPLICLSIRVFSNELALHITWPKYQSFSISPSSEYSGLISFRIDWLDLLAVQGTQEIFPSYYFHSSYPLPTCDHKSVLYVIISIAAL